ncbi:Kielin/chordin-like protein [Araneus ventricosus]|uniref:Kielin/chordin-like protein n=1 Tax=Araneus ventricosus TaxID=182803 RepID=A0A4Y2DX14_ARAVE|nr:Kielin/chordin-like protein [Araneus ventricosus]
MGSLNRQSVQCSCPDGFSGPLCEQTITSCSPIQTNNHCNHSQGIWYFDSLSNQCKSTVSGCFEPRSTFLTFEECSTTCLQGTCCYRMKIGEIPDMICQPETMKNCQLLCQDDNIEVLGFYPGIKCPNEGCGMIASKVCHTGISLYSPGSTFSFGCETCECFDEHISCSCHTLNVRKEIRELSYSERIEYQRAVAHLQAGGDKSVWTSLRNLYVTHIMHANSPQYFLLWNRNFLRTMERHLQEYNCSITIPYFDFTLDAGNLSSSVVWRQDFFGSPSPNGSYCQKHFIHKSSTLWTPCVKRDIKVDSSAPTMIDVALALSKSDFFEFTSALQGISSYMHSFMGGDMETANSPHDPIFYSLHAFIDSLFWKWQQRHSVKKLKKFKNEVLEANLIPFNTKQKFLIDSEKDLCVTYASIEESERERNRQEFRSARPQSNNHVGCSGEEFSPFTERICDAEMRSLVDTGHRIQTVLYNQEERFLKTLPRTCFSSHDIPKTYVNQIWNVQPDNFKPQSNFQSVDMKSEWCDRFCFPADIFLPPESNDSFEVSPCSGNQVQIPICEETILLKCPYYTFAPCRLSLCGNCSLTCHVNNQDIECKESEIDFCSPNPCKNGGTCKPSEWPSLSHLVSCDCPPGFEGVYCEEKSTQRCSLPLNPGKLSGCGPPEKRWYFDFQNQECYSFMYHGCSGNANNFPSYYECRITCKVGACCWRTPRFPGRVHGFNADGYNRYGFSADGRSRNNEVRTLENGFGGGRGIYRFKNFDYEGYDTTGYNRDGVDRYGYNTAGYHYVTKFNLTGYNVYGDYDGLIKYDTLGYDKDGYNRAGFNCYGYSAEGWDYYGLTAGWRYDCRAMNLKDCQKMEKDSTTIQVVAFSPGKKCEEAHCEEQCGCSFLQKSYSFKEKIPLGCGSCECTVSGRIRCPCTTVSIRKEIRDMTSEEMKRYQSAVKTLALQETWQNLTNLYREYMPQSRGNSYFLPWHRFFLRYAEIKLQEIDCSVTIPYFDWTLDVGSMETSVVWQANYFGGNGDKTQNNCVRYHPFKNYHPLFWKNCLRRDFNSSVYFPNAIDLEKLLRIQSFEEFNSQLDTISGLFHLFVGGHMASTESTYDPIFFSHYAFIDKIWYDWTSENPNNIAKFPSKHRYTSMAPFAVSPDDVLRSDVQLCVTYKDITEGAPCIDGSRNNLNKFSAQNVLPNIFDTNGYDTEGYDAFGYDRMGWKKSGIFRDSFNRDGFDLDGYDRNGFDRYGFDRSRCNPKGFCISSVFHNSPAPPISSSWEEFNELGYRPTGFDFHGYDVYGFDANGYDRNNCSYFFKGPFYPLFMKNVRKEMKSLPPNELDKIKTNCPYMSELPEWWVNLYWLNRNSLGKLLHLSPSVENSYSPFSTNKNLWLAPTPEERFCFQLHHHSKCELNKPPVPCPFHTCGSQLCPTLPSAQCRNFGCGSCDTNYFNVVAQKATTCNKNDCISVDGNVKADGEVWEEELCYSCTCQAGLVSCSSVQCDTACDHPVSVPGSCCPVCDGCMKGGIIYASGESFIDLQNPCLKCTCKSGSILCTTVECAPMKPCMESALVTLDGECCPTCSMCGPHREGSHWMESPCHNCSCYAGNVHCNVINCPLLTCQYPARSNGECCRHCDDCEYRGNYVKNGDAFSPEACVECRCQKGNIACQKIDCFHSTCTDPRNRFEQCCSHCQNGCQYDGRDYEDGSLFNPSFNPCLNCSCEKGIVRCQPVKCPDPEQTCEIPVFPPGGCCPYCPKCTYNGKEYTNGKRWRISNTTCEACVCMNGIVSCSDKESCPGQKCTHGVVPAGECCSPCIDCKYNSYIVHDQMQFSPPDDPCARCMCRKGNITCVRETCPKLLCTATELPAGACCSVCKGCTNSVGQPVEHGQKWIHHSDVCQECTCRDGVSKCDRIACKIPCTHPVMRPDVCCPECNGCQVLGKIYQNNAEIPSSDACRKCYCYKGNMECESVSCPAMTCENSRKEPGSCCPTCKECHFQGIVAKDGETFQPQSDSCYSCTCDKGAVYCERRNDRCNPQCINPIKLPGQCCPVCDGCEYENKDYKNRERFTPNPDEPCLQCECSNGNVRCFQQQCPKLSCRNPQKIGNKCCEECVEYCVDENNKEKIYQEGEVWLSPENECNICACKDSMVQCQRVDCPAVHCQHPAAPFGVCCPECEHCEFTHRLYRNGQEFTHEEDPCQVCRCENGTVSCDTILCDPLPCMHPEELEGICCPICTPDVKCRHGGKVYDAWENFLDPDNPCSECVCVDGMASCHPVLCLNTECPNPQFGHCCESCDGCSYGEKNYINHFSFNDPLNPCRSCQCESGAVSCQQSPCPPVECENAVYIEGECCPVCRDCMFKGGFYKDGDTFRDPEDDCNECYCQYPEVVCQKRGCSDGGCVDVMNSGCSEMGAECHFYDEIHESGTVFTHPENPCEVCSCQNRMVTCFEQHCPVVRCSHPVQTNCCSVCTEGCLFEGNVYKEWHVLPEPGNPCQECVCQSGNMTCKQKQCPSANCKYPSMDGCCPVCRDCFYNNELIPNGQNIPSSNAESCDLCFCYDGNVECKPKACATAHCSSPVIKECCPTCDYGCFYNNKTYQPGEKFADLENPCEVCICEGGNIRCMPKQCPPTNCSNPVVVECCPTCETGCMFEDQYYEIGAKIDYPNRPCDICTCRAGNVQCNPKPCGSVNCSHPAIKNCCPSCDSGCLYDRKIFYNGEVFSDPAKPCETCTCKSGNVDCKPKTCDVVYCSNPVIENCCPVCDLGCLYEGKVYNFGAEFDDPVDPCSECACMKGTVYCDKKPCETPECINVITDEENCCPYCPDFCEYNGKRHELDAVFSHTTDACKECTCLNGDVHCEEKICPDTPCLHPALGECCLECLNCQFHDGIYTDNTTFTNPENTCETCFCSKGQVACEKFPCVQCLHPISHDSNCCPVCDGCLYAGINITNQQRFVSPGNPCEECICKNGTVTCHTLACSLPACANPVMLPGVCCPVCPGCTVSGIQFEENKEFTHPDDVCEKCVCKDGHVACNRQICERNCTHPTPDPCCPICNDCLFETVKYSNGERFNPDSCRSCECKDGNVVCASEVCLELNCQLRVRLPGQCCEVCRGCVYEGTEYENDAMWISPHNPCLSCKCTGGTVSCKNIICPIECVEPRPVPGRCCPVCPECERDGVKYKSGERFSPPSRPCDSCTCDSGHIFCIRHECPVLIDCPEESIRPPSEGECCPTCAAFGSVCTRDQIGQLFYPYPDPCFVCQCSENFMWVCSKEFCPPLNCPAEEILKSDKECCPKCGVCISEGNEIHLHGDSWSTPNDPCNICSCDYGSIHCNKTICSEISCRGYEIAFRAPGECCSICISSTDLSCDYGGAYYENGQSWKPDPCTTCLCTQGKMHCHNERCIPLDCTSDEILSVDPGQCCPKCIPRPATCLAFGDPHYRTFDGASISFQGTCRYVLTADCSTQKFTIVVENNDRGFNGVSWTHRVVVVLQNASVDLRSGPMVYVKGKHIEHLPYFEDPVLYVEKTGRSVLVTTDVGVQVLWNGDGYVEVTVSGVYRGKTCGLCGNFNNFPEDDMRTPGNQTVTSEAKFGNSWKYGDVQPGGCTESVDIDPCSKGGYRIRKIANTKCSILKQSLFAPCHQFIRPEPFFAACVYDVCACSENDDCLCDILNTYSKECSKAGVILNWRTEGLCGIHCSGQEGLVFDECGPPCPRTCENRNLPIGILASQCFKPCVPGCQCSADKVLHNGRCIRPEFCP